MKGIILAGGKGTRLFPVTKAISKHLIPIYDKPMVYYPLSILMLAGIREILLISTPEDLPLYKRLLGNGKDLGLSIMYKEQEKPAGIAESFLLGEDFIGKDPVCLVLGDNLFYGQGLATILRKTTKLFSDKSNRGGLIFGSYVKNPSAFGVAELSVKGELLSIEEKPLNPKSNYAIPGLYFYSNEVIKITKSIQPSHRGELEITSVNQEFLRRKSLFLEILGRGIAWLDTGTHKGLLEAANFVDAIQARQGLFISCIEEIAYRNGFIDKSLLLQHAKRHENTEYGDYLGTISQIPIC